VLATPAQGLGTLRPVTFVCIEDATAGLFDRELVVNILITSNDSPISPCAVYASDAGCRPGRPELHVKRWQIEIRNTA
jgi:hypothetical protein